MEMPPIDKLIEKTGSAYKLVILAARRALELGEGATKLVDAPLDAKVTSVALQEIMEDKVVIKLAKGEK